MTFTPIQLEGLLLLCTAIMVQLRLKYIQKNWQLEKDYYHFAQHQDHAGTFSQGSLVREHRPAQPEVSTLVQPLDSRHDREHRPLSGK